MRPVTPLQGCFVTGTDTEIGKTRISAALLYWLAQTGRRSAGFKPVSAGTEALDGRRLNEDVRALREASSVALTDAEVGPLQLEAACAPHIAAALEGRAIDRAIILQAARALAARADVLVIEGVGGFCVPLGAGWDTGELARDLALPVVLVVGLRLGCINHALLTAEAILARGLRLAGWVGNGIARDMPWAGENVATLREWLGRRAFARPEYGTGIGLGLAQLHCRRLKAAAPLASQTVPTTRTSTAGWAPAGLNRGPGTGDDANPPPDTLLQLAADWRDAAVKLNQSQDMTARARMEKDLAELQARHLLSDLKPVALEAVDRLVLRANSPTALRRLARRPVHGSRLS